MEDAAACQSARLPDIARVTKIMTELTASEREELLVPCALPKRQAANGRLLKMLLLVCCVSMIAWLGFLGWGFGHLIRAW
jgi:hypothetical protein